MKTTTLLPLALGLVLTGCNRTGTEINKTSSNDYPAANQPTSAESSAAIKKDSAERSQVAATAPPVSATIVRTTTDLPEIAPVSPDIVANPTLSAVTDPTPFKSGIVPQAPTPAELSLPTFSPVAISPIQQDPVESHAKPALSARLAEWKLTGDEIKSEFEKSGKVVRTRLAGANEPTGPMDSILVSSVKLKLLGDADTSALKVEVTAENGVVTLNGTAQSLEQIGRLVGIALDADGVTQAISMIKLEAAR